MLVNIAAAFVLDVLIGDPVFKLHPVRLIGSMLTFFEKIFYPKSRKILGGLLFVGCSLISVFAITFGLEFLKSFLYLPFSVNILSIILIFFLFCNRDMVREAKAVYRYLAEDRISDARRQVARIVGRDTEHLNKEEIIRATVETIAENVVDGFTAPLFYLAVGGIPAAYIYKTVNTIDSRFGYRDKRYEKFGKPGAYFDDLLNFIPARLDFFFLLCAVKFNKMVYKTMVRDGSKHPSPNSGISEAGFAGWLGIALGGASIYGGVKKVKPLIGENRLHAKEREDARIILKAIALYWKVITVTLCFFMAAFYFLRLPLFFR